MVNIQTGLNDLKTNVDDLDVDKVKTVTADLNKLNDIVKKKLLKNKMWYTQYKSKWFRKKIPVANTLIHINQYNRDK